MAARKPPLPPTPRKPKPSVGRRAITRAFVAVGSNLSGPLGDRADYLAAARAALDNSPGLHVGRTSAVCETEPVGGPAGQAPFLNAVWEVETTLSAQALLTLLLEVEKALGRERKVKNGPRVIDLDLIFHGDDVIDKDGVCVPHPEMHKRRFVLEPLVALDPGLTHPVLGRTVAQLLAELP